MKRQKSHTKKDAKATNAVSDEAPPKQLLAKTRAGLSSIAARITASTALALATGRRGGRAAAAAWGDVSARIVVTLKEWGAAGQSRATGGLVAVKSATQGSFERYYPLIPAAVGATGGFATNCGAAFGKLLRLTRGSLESWLSWSWDGLTVLAAESASSLATMTIALFRRLGRPLARRREERLIDASNRASMHDLAAAPLLPATPFHRLRYLAASAFAIVGMFVIGFGVWSIYAPLESAAIAGGAIAAESSRKTIQHLEGGIIGRILVQDGDVVAAGQSLIGLDDTKARATVQMLQGQLWDAQALEARLVAERDNRETILFPKDMLSVAQHNPAVAGIVIAQNRIFDTRRNLQASRIEIIEQRKAQTEQEIAGLRFQAKAAAARAAIIKGEIAAVAPLVAKRLQTRARLLQIEREQAEIDGRIGDTMSQMSRAGQAIGESRAMILKLESDYQSEVAEDLRETQSQILQLAERFQAASDILTRTIVRAPEAGTVTDLRIHTTGGVVAAGEPLLDLVPSQDRLIVMAQVKPEDIDLVHPGLTARVRLLSYKHRRVPPVEGVLTYVSADRLIDTETKRAFYTARIRITEASLRALPEVEIMAGMPVEILINTGTFTVAHYALRPVFDSFNRAFRED